ncbi:NADH-dependent flavin oxidoreductase [Peribacillus sp. JNUCC 23]
MKAQYKPLFEPYVFRSGVKIKNRISMAPMTTKSAYDDGSVSEDELNYYSRRANGVGMVITACAHVTLDGKAWNGGFGADTDVTIPSLTRLASTLKKQGTTAVLQIFHAGFQNVFRDRTSPQHEYLSALNSGEIDQLITDFGEATRRAIAAGFDGVEIHGANHYLIHQFFSAQTNRRDDHWGGSFEKRMKFPLAVVDQVLQTVKQHAKKPFLVGYRISPEETGPLGFTMADSLELMDQLSYKELDYLHISSGDFWSVPRRGAPATNSRLHWIMQKVGDRIPVMGIGSIQTADDALKALESGIPLIALGRALLMEPDWIKKIELGNESEIITEMRYSDQNRLVIPAPMWNVF